MAIPKLNAPAGGSAAAAPASVGGYAPLPWGGGNAAAAFGAAASGDVNAIGNAYGQAYNSALAMNQANYNNVMQGYQNALTQQTSAQQAIQAGYTGLYNDVIGRIGSIGEARKADINEAWARETGRISQQSIDRGIGNTTIMQSLERGLELDRQRNLTQLSDARSQTEAGYMQSLGLAGLQNQNRALDQNLGLTQAQLNMMADMRIAYPDASMYANLAQQAAQSRARREFMDRPENMPSTHFGFGGGSFGSIPKVGYTPGGGPYRGAGGSGAIGSTGMGAASPGGMSSFGLPPMVASAGYGGGYGGGYDSYDSYKDPADGGGAGKGFGGLPMLDYSQGSYGSVYDDPYANAGAGNIFDQAYGSLASGYDWGGGGDF